MLKINLLRKNIPPVLSIVIVSFFAAFVLNVVWAWTGPTLVAPTGNIGAPINVSLTSQSKDGALGVGAFVSFGDAYFYENVGIGTTDPQRTLHVLSSGGETIRADGGGNGATIGFAKSGTREGLVGIAGAYEGNSSVDIGLMADTSGGGIRFYTNGSGTAKAVIDSSGNVGIGTTTPGYKLDVQNGQINVSGGLCIAGVCKTSWSEVTGTTYTSTNPISIGTGNVISLKYNTADFSVSATDGLQLNSGRFSGWDTDASNDLTTASTWSGDLSGTGLSPTVAKIGGNAISATASSNGQVLKWNSTANRWEPGTDTGSVPGGSSGQVQFNEAGSFGGSTNLVWKNTDALLDVGGSIYSSGGIGTAGNISIANNSKYIGGSGGNDYILMNDVAGQGFMFFWDGIERMRIDTSGNVGIGTTNPGAKLEVAGQVKITGGLPSAGKVLTSDATGLASWTAPASAPVTSVFGRTGVVVAAPNDYHFSQVTGAAPSANPTFTGNIFMPGGIWNISGNVGIGTAGPFSKLSVGGQGNERYTIYGYSSGIVDSAAVYGENTSNSGYGVIGANDNNVGVWGYSRDNKGVYGYGGKRGVYAVTNNANGEALYADNWNSSGYAIYASGGKNYFGGNVGIGTNNPLSKLSVGGTGNSNYAIYGQSNKSSSVGVYGETTITTTSDSGRGVYGKSAGGSGYGVYGEATGTYGVGVYGEATGTYGVGVYGSSMKLGQRSTAPYTCTSSAAGVMYFDTGLKDPAYASFCMCSKYAGTWKWYAVGFGDCD